MRGGGWRSARVGTKERLSHVGQDRNGMTDDDQGRSAGVQLHPTSLPSGRLDEDAYAFVDWLVEAGQSWWQMLPLTPPDEHGSPYKSASAFAAWPGLLAEPDAPVSASEERAFREREAFWVE